MPIITRRVVLGAGVEPPAASISELFHENTKLHPSAPTAGFVPDVYSDSETEAMSAVGRRYHRAPQTVLPPPDPGSTPGASLASAIRARRTCRSFGAAPISLQQLSHLLFLTNGVTARAPIRDNLVRELRATPSAGALYPIEIYLGVRSVEGLSPGLYHFEPRAHALACLAPGDPTPALTRGCHYEASMNQAALVVIFAGVFARTRRKYGERGYRYVLLEAGHTAQNLGLGCVSLGLGCMHVCGFFDDRLNELFALDGVDESALYVAYVGQDERPGATGGTTP